MARTTKELSYTTKNFYILICHSCLLHVLPCTKCLYETLKKQEQELEKKEAQNEKEC